MTAEAALSLLGAVSGALVLWNVTLNRRIHRLEEQAGLRKPQRALFDD